ncbi:MAG: choline ABC transporter ATP-binding protein [Hoeflea sp.]|uniref:choline ABC transporter ATP-binding protein n=1 Tax=Hoeflea sp. TaxID=1940281 RepID=UPI001D1B2108|nr:choline ABC transporter ATP-binding protein [Hoeflea sp.]MBU4527316.1 choline ABC transporter ATP-binding protein [Alphaproteobacteria bacterium]MBU4546901.1 choline ABC transporter ATP-binding protein [Alphaproteobacteria bacterium]MBU4551587.1 choline ABC transporter ATP-binding protein [Alphaproteobacteria bacterium]MBV1725592.1 choline ABC transporter ATP-binding protein [Hoeflea sp.]MBV1759640.1 choline ABC transporter ATP-binding protein [Hoeflea sp.]
MSHDAYRGSVRIQNVSIIFGDKTAESLALADAGKSRTEIQEITGDVLGVHNCTVDVNEGEILVLMGLSGSGKSTLLRAVNRLNPISRGSLIVNCGDETVDVAACDARQLKQLRMDTVSMVFQQFGLLPWRSVSDNVGFGLEISGVPKAERDDRVKEQLALVGLSDWADRMVAELSGGMQQRVGLARAFATGAPILLMDEPFSALDPLIRTRLQDELLELQSRLGKTIIFVSHDLDEAMKLGNRIAIMEGGRIIQCGTPRDIVNSPVNKYVADFVANMNPIAMLSAKDVMTAGKPAGARGQLPLSASVTPDTPLAEVMDALARRDGTIGVIDNGAVAGSITAEDIVRGLTRHRR